MNHYHKAHWNCLAGACLGPAYQATAIILSDFSDPLSDFISKIGQETNLTSYSDHRGESKKYTQVSYIVIHSPACCSELPQSGAAQRLPLLSRRVHASTGSVSLFCIRNFLLMPLFRPTQWIWFKPDGRLHDTIVKLINYFQFHLWVPGVSYVYTQPCGFLLCLCMLVHFCVCAKKMH